jgi:3-hydroxyacyl-[acyl-carrier-protein] dehydratase
MAPDAIPTDVVQRLKIILRRDLKLGPSAPIEDDMPLFGGEADLDSLDVLMLLTSIEKELGIKVPGESVARKVFQSVRTLAAYIHENQNSGHASGGAVDYLSHLPHRPPFRFVTAVRSVAPGESAQGEWALTGEEPFFAGHFPGQPIVPAVLIAEALAQISGLAGPPAGSQNGAGNGKLVHFDLRFDQSVVPPAQIVLKARFERAMGSLQQFAVEASVGDAVVARGMIALQRGGGGTP